MTKKKRGRVVRLSDFAHDYITANKGEGQSTREVIDQMIMDWAEMIARLQKLESARVLFALSGSLYSTKKEARGESVLRAVRTNSEPEEPIRVRLVD